MQEIRFITDVVEVAATVAKAEKFNARAAKKGLQGGWTFKGVEVTKIYVNGVERLKHELVFVGEPIKFGDWAFVAVVEWLEGKPFVNKLPGYEGEQINAHNLVQGVCDHCNQNRSRKHVLIVEKNGVRKQVGSTCVKDFLGWNFSPTYFNEREDLDCDFGGRGYSGLGISTVEVLALAVAIVSVKGWCSRSQAAGQDKDSTADLVDIYLYDEKEDGENLRREVGDVTDEHRAEAIRLIEWVSNWNADNDYANNLKVAASLEVATSKTQNTLISVIGTEARIRAKAAENAAAEVETFIEARYAEDGTKIEVEAKVISKRWFEGAYGPTALVVFTADGHRFQWWGTAACIDDLESGQIVALKGTVKGVKEHNDKTYTQLTRCKAQVLQAQ